MGDCVLCFLPIVKHSDRNLVQVRDRGEFKVDEAGKPFTRVCCTLCDADVHLWTMRWTSTEATLMNFSITYEKFEEEFFNEYSSKAFKAGLTATCRPILSKSVKPQRATFKLKMIVYDCKAWKQVEWKKRTTPFGNNCAMRSSTSPVKWIILD